MNPQLDVTYQLDQLESENAPIFFTVFWVITSSPKNRPKHLIPKNEQNRLLTLLFRCGLDLLKFGMFWKVTNQSQGASKKQLSNFSGFLSVWQFFIIKLPFYGIYFLCENLSIVDIISITPQGWKIDRWTYRKANR